MTAKLRALAALLIVGGAFGAGWAVNGWRLGEQAAKTDRQRAEATAATWRQVVREVERLQSNLSAATNAGREQLERAQDETNRLRACIDRGDCGLRVRVERPVCPGTVPAADGGPVDTAAGAPLAAAARPDYFALRSAIEVTEAKLTACQKALGALAAPAATLPPAGP